ncbi:MAG: hypothetical protein LLG16_05275, partial [Euryarchaeota archaeon]|nr:hypothetical protein [Euryarchaeota archaeon]
MEKELAEWKEKDPIKRFKIYIEGKGIWNEEKEAQLQEEIAAIVEAEVKKAEAVPRPSIEDMFKFTYAEMTDDLKEQMGSLTGSPVKGKEG